MSALGVQYPRPLIKRAKPMSLLNAPPSISISISLRLLWTDLELSHAPPTNASACFVNSDHNWYDRERPRRGHRNGGISIGMVTSGVEYAGTHYMPPVHLAFFKKDVPYRFRERLGRRFFSMFRKMGRNESTKNKLEIAFDLVIYQSI